MNLHKHCPKLFPCCNALMSANCVCPVKGLSPCGLESRFEGLCRSIRSGDRNGGQSCLQIGTLPDSYDSRRLPLTYQAVRCPIT